MKLPHLEEVLVLAELILLWSGLPPIASKTPPGIKSAAESAIEHHWLKGLGNLKTCWLIYSGKESEKTARQIVQKFTAHPKSQDPTFFDFDYVDPDDSAKTLKIKLKTLPEKDVDDPNATFMLINSIYEEAAKEGIEVADIIADYTGGTKSMTAGLILACAQPERRLQFMCPGKYTDEGRADTTVDSVATEVKVSFRLKAVR